MKTKHLITKFLVWILIVNTMALAVQSEEEINAEARKSGIVFAIVVVGLAGIIIWSLSLFSKHEEEKEKKREELLKEKAQSGDAKSQYQFGKDLFNSEVGVINKIEGIKWMLKAAEQQYEPGLQTAKYCLRSIENFKSLIDYCKAKGHEFFKEKEYKKAIVYYDFARSADDPTATYNLGVCYFNGYGVKKDIDEAVSYFLEAAREKHPLALYQLGVCYENGRGVTRDISLAMEYYEQANKEGVKEARQKVIQSVIKRGDYLYEEGKIDKAVLVYDKGADAGDLYCKERAIECGQRVGTIFFAAFKENGEQEDLEKAIGYYNIAAKHGDVDAQFCLGFGYLYTGANVLAFKWFEISAQGGCGLAQYYCGKCCENGIGVDKNYITALAWYKKAAQNGIAEAQERVSHFEPFSEYAGSQDANDQEQDPYQILEVDRNASLETIKQAYLNKVKNLHPDYLKAKGLSEEVIKLVTSELARINLAWEMIKKERGL